VFANGEGTQREMVNHAQLHYDANMWRSQEHSRDNRAEYLELAERDARAATEEANTDES